MHIYEIKKNGTDETFCKAEINTQTEITNYGHQRGGRWGSGMNSEIGIDIYTLLCIKQITNENILCSIGNSTQYSVMTYMGKESKRVDTCTCVTDSLCCRVETEHCKTKLVKIF